MNIILSDNAKILRTFFIIDGKVISGKVEMHLMLYDMIVSKGKANKNIPYYYYPRGVLYDNDDLPLLIGPKELNATQIDKLKRVFKLDSGIAKYSTSPHYSEEQIVEFIKNEEYDVSEETIEDELEYALEFFKTQVALF